MSSIFVAYRGKKVKVPVTPSTQLSSIRDQVCEANGFNLPSADYVLARHDKPLDMTIAFRLANISNNAQLDLIPRPQNTSTRQVRVKIRIPNGQDYIGSFPPSTTIEEVVRTAKFSDSLQMGNVIVAPETPLSSLGTSGLLFTLAQANKGSLRQTPSTKQAPTTKQAPSTKESSPRLPIQAPNKPAGSIAPSTRSASSSTSPATPTTAPTTAPAPSAGSLREPVVALPSKTASLSVDDREMDAQQFMTYYNHIKAQGSVRKATNVPAPAAASTVRVRFLDHSYLAGKFIAGEKGADVYQFVRSYLRDPRQKFALVSMKPKFTLDMDVDATEQLGTRAMLVYIPEVKTSGPVLSERALRMAQPPAAPAAPTAGAQAVQQQKLLSQKQEKEKAKETKDATVCSKGKFSLKPKWLKLHKGDK